MEFPFVVELLFAYESDLRPLVATTFDEEKILEKICESNCVGLRGLDDCQQYGELRS